MATTHVPVRLALMTWSALALVLPAGTQAGPGTKPAAAAETASSRLDAQARFEIPAQSLSSALVQFSRQADLQLVTASVELGDKETRGVSGRLSLRQALIQLLNQTGLSYSLVGENTVAIVASSQGAETSGPSRRDPAVMMARANIQSSDEQRAASTGAQAPAPADKESDQKGIPQILVEGARDRTRSYNVDLPRSEDDAKPYYIFDSETIQSSGAVSLQDFLFQRLPMNAEAMPLSQHLPTNVGAGLATVSMIDLRGLGTDQTLVLVNGRRLSTVSIRGVDRQPDINGIPLSAVDRIEVLPSSSSGIYGGGAVGGVINIILRRDYAGSEVKVNYGNTTDHVAARTRYEFTSGFAFEEGRTHMLVSATYSDAEPMRRGDRLELFMKGRRRYLESNPVAISSVPLGSTPNIYSANGTPLTLKNGGVELNSPITHIPVGYTGVASDGGAALVNNAGAYNEEFADLPFIGKQQPTNSAFRTKALQFNLRRHMSDRLELFIDTSYTMNITPMKRGALLSALLVPASADVNPFNQDVRIYPPSAPAAPMDAESNVLRASLGFIMKLRNDWQLQGDYSASRSNNDFNLGSVNSTALQAEIEAGNINPFVDTQTYPFDLEPFFVTYVGDYASSLNDLALRTAGPIWQLPGGKVTLAANLSSRTQKQLPSTEDFVSTPAPSTNSTTFYLEQKQRTDSAYVELTIPIFGRDNALPGVRMVDLQVAGRHEIYRVGTLTTPTGARSYASTQPTPDIIYASTRYDSTNPVLGLRYQPVDDVMLRASWATAFRPPFYYHLQPGNRSTAATTNVVDPQRGNEQVSVYRISGGNPDIEPETGKNWTFGLVYTPSAVPGLRLAADYVRIQKRNNISTLTPQLIVDNEHIYGSRVVRENPAPGDTFGVGQIIEVDTSYMNLFRSQVESIDFSASYRFETRNLGAFHISAIATRNLHYIQQISVDIPEREYVDFPAVSGGNVKFKGNMTIGWERGPWTANWVAYYYSDYGQYGPPFTTSMVYLNPHGGLGARIPSQHFHDMSATYRFPDAGLGSGLWQRVVDKMEIQAGVKNVFNKEGEFDAYHSFNGYMSPFARLELRTYWVTLKKGF